MSIKRLGMSYLAKEAGFGNRIWSEPGYWGGRFYNLIIAAGTIVILIVSLFQHVSLLFLGAVLVAYACYLVIRLYFIRGYEFIYYRPWPQFVRAQFSMGLLTLLMAWLGKSGIQGDLWLLYTLQLMIIGRHLSTRLFLACVLEVWLFLAGLRLLIMPAQSLTTFIQANPDLIVQWAWIALIGFVIHYLLRNIDARDATIAVMSQINALVNQSQTERETETRWEAILGTYLRYVGGGCGSVWLYNQHTGKIRLLTNLSYCQGESCPAFRRSDDNKSITIDSDHPLAKVVRTGQPAYCRSQVEGYLSRTGEAVQVYPLPPGIYATILVPIHEEMGNSPSVLGVLCIDFDQANPPREHLLAHYYEFLGDIAQQIAPSLQFIRRIAEQQMLRQVGVQVSSSLRLEDVLNDTLDALTGPLGFEMATISLVDKNAKLIRCMAGRNVSPEWIAQARHPLTSTDIQADVVRQGKMEVISGWDKRFDKRIYHQFRHHELIRAFIPIRRQQDSDDQSLRVHGVVEVGYNLRSRTQIAPEQLALLTTFVDQVAVAIEKARLFEDTLRHRELLVQLHQVSHDIADARQPDDVLEKLGEALQRVLKADIVMIYRFNRITQTIEPPQVFGQVWGRRPIQMASLDRGIIAEILRQGQPYYAADVIENPLLSEPYPPLARGEKRGSRRTFTLRQNIKSFAGAPMRVNGEIVGVLCVNYRRRHAFDQNEQWILESAAQLAAVALRNAEFNALSAELAVKEERNRLAAQLHDSVSQFLPAIQLMADTALKLLPTQSDQTVYWLERVQCAVRQTMAEIRVNLFEMSVTTTRSRNLRQALLESAALAREYFNLEVDISPQAIPEELSIPIEAELLLICREAIVNASRHANARRVTVEFSEANGLVRLKVQDDGCGFDLSTLSKQGIHGLKVMGQRVERMGGRLSIRSQPGEGTMLEATVPH